MCWGEHVVLELLHPAAAGYAPVGDCAPNGVVELELALANEVEERWLVLVVERRVSTQQHEQNDAAGPHIRYMRILDAWALLRDTQTESQRGAEAGSQTAHPASTAGQVAYRMTDALRAASYAWTHS
jgi:hypothetical protein